MFLFFVSNRCRMAVSLVLHICQTRSSISSLCRWPTTVFVSHSRSHPQSLLFRYFRSSFSFVVHTKFWLPPPIHLCKPLRFLSVPHICDLHSLVYWSVFSVTWHSVPYSRPHHGFRVVCKFYAKAIVSSCKTLWRTLSVSAYHPIFHVFLQIAVLFSG